MSNDSNDLTLAGDFAQATDAEWFDAVAKVFNRNRPEDKQLSGEQAVARLKTTTVDGLTIEPLYTRPEQEPAIGVPGQPPFTRGTTVRKGEMDAWDVRALFEDPDVATTKKHILEDLERGVTSLWLRVDPDAIKASDVPEVLADVILDLAKVVVSSRTNQAAAAEALLAVYENCGKDKAKLAFNLSLDPIGEAALNGKAADLSGMKNWVERVAEYPQARPFVADSTIWHNAGAGDVHEIAFGVATAVEYVRHLIEAGMTPDAAFDAVNFKVTAGTDQFLTICRLRALRTLWNRVGEVLGVSAEHRGARQEAVQSLRQMTREDVAVNILRGTICCFSAAVGGAEAITVMPYDTVHGLPTQDSRRIARNTQIVLAEESNIGRVNDPAGGSWYVENLTSELQKAAWVKFQQIEAAGGMIEAIASGLVAKELEELKAKRAKLLATRKLPITGVSEFPQVHEKPLDNKARPAAAPIALDWTRDSEMFEALRDRAAKGAQPVFLACLGTRRDFGAREGFASNVFHIAGLETPEVEGGTTEEIVAAWKAAATPVVCLCSSTKLYAEQGQDVAKALKEAGAKLVILAGAPKELGEGGEAVIDRNIAMGIDVVETLTAVLDTMGVEK